MHDHQQHSHGEHAGHNPEVFKRKFWLTLVLTIPVIFFSPTIQELLGFTLPYIPGDNLIPPILGIVIFLYGGLVFLKGAKAEIIGRRPGMMTLISLAISVAFGYSLAVSLGLPGMDFWWELATLIVIMLLGHWIEMASITSAQNSLQEIAKLLPDEAEIVEGDETKKVSLETLRMGDVMIIRPGAHVPADGVVLKGASFVNESMITGESKSVEKSMRSLVIGGTLNESGSLYVTVTKTGDDTMIAGIMRLVAEAQKSKSKTQILADKAAFYLTFVALGVALLTAVGWTLFGQQSAAFVLERVVTVLVVACPHALGLAIPLVTAISTTRAAKNGLLIRQRSALEAARLIDVVLFDKTGTLTKGEQGVIDIISVHNNTDHLLALAASAETDSEHPVAKAILVYAKEHTIKIPTSTMFAALPGRGVTAVVEERTMHVGGPQLLKELSVEAPHDITAAAERAAQDGKMAVYVVQDESVIGLVTLADVIREQSHDAVRALQNAGKRVALLTGDAKGVAAWVARELNIDEVFAEVLPGDKASIVKRLQLDGSKVAMVGDGVNDAPALTQADVGIAIGAGTDVAIESAGIILVSNDPRSVAKIITLSGATYRKMVQNLWWATGYNIVALPLAAGVTAGFGFILSPALGAILMSLSTIIVAINAQLLRKTRL